jgi:hypothetical protein
MLALTQRARRLAVAFAVAVVVLAAPGCGGDSPEAEPTQAPAAVGGDPVDTPTAAGGSPADPTATAQTSSGAGNAEEPDTGAQLPEPSATPTATVTDEPTVAVTAAPPADETSTP